MFEALKPAELELALAAVDELERRDQAVMRQWQMRIERAEYECALAERRYRRVDPANDSLPPPRAPRKYDCQLLVADIISKPARVAPIVLHTDGTRTT